MSPNPYPIQLNHLSFSYTDVFGERQENVLDDLTLTITPGKRCLVVGANGAGKSTLLRVFAGKHLVQDETQALVFGKDAFRDTSLNLQRTFVGTDWGVREVAFSGNQIALSGDIGVSEMMVALQQSYPERRDLLMKVLRINPLWRMHRLSTGQRVRVQLFLALIRPSKLILIDEVLGVLDIVTRQDFLSFLEKESANGACILLATNVFDGLEDWSTDIIFISNGKIGYYGETCEIPQLKKFRQQGCSEPLMRTIEYWLRQEIERIEKEEYDEEKERKGLGRAGGYASGRLGDFRVPN